MKAATFQEDQEGNVIGVRFVHKDGEPFLPVAVKKPQAQFAAHEFTVADGKAAEVAEAPVVPAEGV